MPDDRLQYSFDNWDYSEATVRQTAVIANTILTTDISDMTISYIDKLMIDSVALRQNGLFPAYTFSPFKERDGTITISREQIPSKYYDTIYIYTTFPISIKIAPISVIFPGKYLGRKDIRVIDDIFTIGEVIDIHPWLLYLIQVNPVKYFFTDSLFGGKMAPPLKFKLAYYIVAHYVATHDPAYKENPSIFYKLPDSEKIPKMLAALKKEKCLQDDLLTAGYRWLNRESVKEVRPSMKELIDTRFGSVSGLFNRTAKGGKRQTRKVRFANL